MSGRALLPVATPARIRVVVGTLLRPHRGRAVLAVVALAGGAGAGLLVPPLLGWIIDLVTAGAGPDAMTRPAALLVAVAVAQGLLAVLGVAQTARVGEIVLAALRERLVERTLGLPLERIEAAGAGDIGSRVTEDVAQVGEAVREGVPALARYGLVIVLTFVGLALLDWRFLLAAVVGLPIQVLTARWYLRRATPVSAEQRVAAGAQQQQLLDTATSLPTVRAFRLGDRHGELVHDRSQRVVDLALSVVRLQNGFFGRLNLAEYVGVALVLVTGFWLVRTGAVSLGTASAAALYFIALFNPLNEVLLLLQTVQAAGAGLARIVGAADLPEQRRSEPVRGTGPAHVRAAGLVFGYPGVPAVLGGVDIDVPAGTRLAVVGPSGAGKTTLAKVIAGVHEPSGGTIGLDPAAVVLVTQEVHVFAGPVADDLRLARPEASETELRSALATVDALAWVDALPGALATVVGDGGHGLTAVQAQQLALARLVLADPPVAILDEATAEAGSAGARALEASARQALAGRTALVVAHRLSQATDADAVLLLDGGKVVEYGSHADLLAADGPYAALWAAWSGSR
ncbi:ABC transporter ATP-binding protein/permease [Pseudonocardia sp. RS11V-5]|uniref:ABC transporter ATP-binding protein n=1 Tax=Pseudonocardia terrae TaxID=2905831 RepID=UPI001E33FD24|nr:ABC transporter ATP-binding protein [Pseudonocardia terrae]MCE3554388.1 ABC transporter ATP-binding protein/permease [Pseudonocardia terrae]